jgi:hypothetical protein
MQDMRPFRLPPRGHGRILHASKSFSKEPNMDLSVQRPALTLETGQVVTLDGAAGRRISARFGSVWVTEEGNAKDFVLAGGETLVVKGRGRTVVQALQPSYITIQ